MQLTIDIPDKLAMQLQNMPNFNEFVTKMLAQSLNETTPNHLYQLQDIQEDWFDLSLSAPMQDITEDEISYSFSDIKVPFA